MKGSTLERNTYSFNQYFQPRRLVEFQVAQGAFAALNREGGEARVVGGAVRNTLLGTKVSDIDLATTHLPQDTVRLVQDAGFKPVPTGIEHGTVTVVVQGNLLK